MINVEHVTMQFRMTNDKIESLKETLIAFLSGKLKYEKFTVLDDVSFNVKKGEVVGIIGKNGAGKSTLLKIISGVLKPTSGKVTANGNIVPMLELGSGFAFIGRQKEIIVAGKTRKIDMLFYHIKLRCYVVVELKAVSFEPEFAGKLNFYVNAVNQLMKTDDDNPTIGLLICKDKDQTEVQWAFQGIETPMGVATYDNIRMNEIKSQLPSEEAIQKRLEQAEEEYLLKLQEKNK